MVDLVAEARLDAKAFRENTVYDSEGDAIRLIANAERLDQYADHMEAQAAEIARLREALRALELANDRVCGARPQRVYDMMIATGMRDAMMALDDARRRARDALAGKAEQ